MSGLIFPFPGLAILRAKIESTLHHMIGLLDLIDALSEDLEDDAEDMDVGGFGHLLSADHEPLLGWPDNLDQSDLGQTPACFDPEEADDERELDEAERSGIGDLDGLYEQMTGTMSCPGGVGVQ